MFIWLNLPNKPNVMKVSSLHKLILLNLRQHEKHRRKTLMRIYFNFWKDRVYKNFIWMLLEPTSFKIESASLIIFFNLVVLVIGCEIEMVESMKKVAKLDCKLTVEERNLLSVGYKNVIGARRASWRIMSSIEQKEESKGNEENVKLIKGYRRKVEEELSNICTDILSIIDKHLIPSSSSGEATVFYYKMYVLLFHFFILNLSVRFLLAIDTTFSIHF